MRQIYTSPREQNIDRVVALFAERGIETKIVNRSNWNPRSYQRFSYTQPQANRDTWPQVWVARADDYARARGLLREIGIEPVLKHGDELATVRGHGAKRDAPNLIRRLLIFIILVIAAFQIMHYYFHLF